MRALPCAGGKSLNSFPCSSTGMNSGFAKVFFGCFLAYVLQGLFEHLTLTGIERILGKYIGNVASPATVLRDYKKVPLPN